MYQPVAEVMQVEALRCDVGAEKHTQRIAAAAETLNQLLLICIGQRAVQYFYLLRLETHRTGQFLLQPVQSLDALRENHQAVSRVVRPPAEVFRFQVIAKRLELAEVRD